MDYQILVNIAVGVITIMGGWVFKMILGHVNEIKEEHHHLMVKHHADVDKIKEKQDQCKSWWKKQRRRGRSKWSWRKSTDN